MYRRRATANRRVIISVQFYCCLETDILWYRGEACRHCRQMTDDYKTSGFFTFLSHLSGSIWIRADYTDNFICIIFHVLEIMLLDWFVNRLLISVIVLSEPKIFLFGDKIFLCVIFIRRKWTLKYSFVFQDPSCRWYDKHALGISFHVQSFYFVVWDVCFYSFMGGIIAS